MELPLWLLSILLTLTLLHILTQRQLRSPAKTNLPPGPRPLPIVGSLFLLGDKPHRSLARLATTYGPVISLKLGQVTTVVISSPELARQVLREKDQSFCARSVPDAVRALGHHQSSVAWLPPSNSWRNLRKILSTQLLVSQKLDANRGPRRQKAAELVAYLRERGAAGEAVDVGRAVFMTVLNLISNTLFSVDMVDPCSESAQGFRDLMWGIMEEAGGSNVSDFFPILRAVDLQGRRRNMEGYFRRLHQIFDELIDGRVNATEKEDGRIDNWEGAKDFLDTLVQFHIHDQNGMELSRPAMKALLAEVFVGGSDTSSNTVEWAMAELLRNPSSMAKVRAELTETLKSSKEVDESDILRLPYLQAIVKETLRLHPPVPLLLPRRTESLVDLCGYTIPKNARVMVNAFAIGRDGDVWKDPEVFMPERFLGRDVEFKGRDFELIPFGAGRRICPGLPLATRMVHLMLATLLHSFSWKLPNGMEPRDVDLTEKFGLTLALAIPIRAIPIPEAL